MSNFDDLDSLTKLNSLSASGEVAKVKRSKPGGSKSKANKESAKNLLGSILDDAAAAAEAEAIRNEEKKRRAEEEARIAKELEEEKARYEAERQLIAEKQAQEDLRIRQAEMQAQLQREKDIEAGLIDLEEEARLAREEEARKRAEEEEKARKVAEKEAATALRISQEHELEALRREQLAKAAAAPKSSKLPMIICIAAGVLLAAGVGVYFMLSQEEMDIYALPEESVTRTIGFIDEDMQMARINASIVKQAEDPKPEKARPKKKAPAAEPAKPKPTLGGGKKGALFGGRRGL
ncbi:MAG: hypothetical protein J6S69_07235 [Proteobacteria bacterium]|nr:hypothetical protein [Pseudomonadota bacterium]